MRANQTPFEQFVTRHGSKALASWFLVFIGLLYLVASITLMWGVVELWQSFTFEEQQCEVRGHDVISAMRRGYWRPVWTVAAMDQKNRRLSDIDDKIISSSTYGSTWRALRVARRKKVSAFVCLTRA